MVRRLARVDLVSRNVLDTRIRSREHQRMVIVFDPPNQVRRRTIRAMDFEDLGLTAMIANVVPHDDQLVTHLRSHRLPLSSS